MNQAKLNEGVSKMNVFKKIKRLVIQVRQVYPDMTQKELTYIVGFLSNSWHGNKKKKHVVPTKQQLVVYGILTRLGYAPATAYEWLLVATASKEIQDKLKYNEIGVREALKLKNKQEEVLTVNEEKFIEELIKCVQTFVSDPGEDHPGVMLQ